MASTSGRAPALTPSTPRARRRPPASTRCAASRGGGGYRSRASSTSLLRDPYRVLGVPDDATPEEIKLAYRRLTKATHPDVNPAKDAAETFRRVNAAYEILADTERRGRFDRGSDFQAMDEGFAPEAETTRRAEAAAWNAPSKNRNTDENAPAHVGREAVDLVVADEETRRKGLRAAWVAKGRRSWDAWCRAWFAALLVGVPAAAGYWLVYGVAAESIRGRILHGG